jgi:hypothetical protein
MILIRKRPDGYVGVVASPHSKQGEWIFEKPISREEFWSKMRTLGSHPVDTADVLHEAEGSGFGYMPG